MAAPLPLNHQADLFEPFGAAIATWINEPCRLVPSLFKGRGAYVAGNYINWSHYVDFNVTANSIKITDGCGRVSGQDLIAWGQGDALRVRTGRGDGTIILAVVWVEWRYIGEDREYIRVYCLRDSSSWTHL